MNDRTVALICLSGNLLCVGTATSARVSGAPGLAWAGFVLASLGFCAAGVLELWLRRGRHRADE